MNGIYLELSFEQAQEIVQTLLMQDFANISEEIALLEDREDLMAFELEDLEDSKAIRKAMKRMLRYYLPRVEADEYIEEIKEMNS
jgi:hypothetical protein